MMTKISYVDKVWNPVVGCTKCSPGCENCYAEKMAIRLSGMGQVKYQQVVTAKAHSLDGKQKWHGTVYCDEKVLDKPLHWRKPRRILCCSMGDLFHEAVPVEFQLRTINVMGSCKQHTFLILTKRPKRMEVFFKNYYPIADMVPKEFRADTPYKNLYPGVSICNQQEADEKIPILLQIPAAKRWLSIEPLLGGINFRWRPYYYQATGETYRQYLERVGSVGQYESLKGIDWVVIGCESGAKRRPCPIDNVRSVVSQCQAAGVGVYVKQLDINGKVEHDINKFPKDLQIRQCLKERKNHYQKEKWEGSPSDMIRRYTDQWGLPPGF